MKKKLTAIIAIAACLNFTACSDNQPVSQAEISSEATVTASASEEADITTATTEITTAPLPQEEIREISAEEQRLRDIVEAEYAKLEHMVPAQPQVILDTLFGDFDKDGTEELIAVCGEYSYPSSVFGEIWYASGGEARLMHSSLQPYYTLEFTLPTIVSWEDYCFVRVEMLYTTGSISHYYLLDSNNFLPCTIDSFACMGLNYNEELGVFTAAHSTYDFSSDRMGHTWKSYDLYFSPEDNTFRHYEGRLITLPELLEIEGAADYINAIPPECEIAEIYRRDSGLININLREYIEGELDMYGNPLYYNSYISLRIIDGSPVDVTEEINEGYYLP